MALSVKQAYSAVFRMLHCVTVVLITKSLVTKQDKTLNPLKQSYNVKSQITKGNGTFRPENLG